MLPRVAHQRIKVNIFDRLAVGIVVALHAAAPGGLSHIDPVGRSAAGSANAVPIHQGFQQQRTTAVVMFPIMRELPCTQRQEFASPTPRPDEQCAGQTSSFQFDV